MHRHQPRSAVVLILLGAFVAGVMMSLYGVQVYYVNRKFVPPEIHAPRWRQAGLLLFSAFFGFFTNRRDPAARLRHQDRLRAWGPDRIFWAASQNRRWA
jgi:hypothetical protein